MPNNDGKDTSRSPRRQVSREGNVYRVNFDPRQNHPSMQPKKADPSVTHSQDTDEAPAQGIPRPKKKK
jgi:hypothetical protein